MFYFFYPNIPFCNFQNSVFEKNVVLLNFCLCVYIQIDFDIGLSSYIGGRWTTGNNVNLWMWDLCLEHLFLKHSFPFCF